MNTRGNAQQHWQPSETRVNPELQVQQVSTGSGLPIVHPQSAPFSGQPRLASAPAPSVSSQLPTPPTYSWPPSSQGQPPIVHHHQSRQTAYPLYSSPIGYDISHGNPNPPNSSTAPVPFNHSQLQTMDHRTSATVSSADKSQPGGRTVSTVQQPQRREQAQLGQPSTHEPQDAVAVALKFRGFRPWGGFQLAPQASNRRFVQYQPAEIHPGAGSTSSESQLTHDSLLNTTVSKRELNSALRFVSPNTVARDVLYALEKHHILDALSADHQKTKRKRASGEESQTELSAVDATLRISTPNGTKPTGNVVISSGHGDSKVAPSEFTHVGHTMGHPIGFDPTSAGGLLNSSERHLHAVDTSKLATAEPTLSEVTTGKAPSEIGSNTAVQPKLTSPAPSQASPSNIVPQSSPVSAATKAAFSRWRSSLGASFGDSENMRLRMQQQSSSIQDAVSQSLGPRDAILMSFPSRHSQKHGFPHPLGSEADKKASNGNRDGKMEMAQAGDFPPIAAEADTSPSSSDHSLELGGAPSSLGATSQGSRTQANATNGLSFEPNSSRHSINWTDETPGLIPLASIRLPPLSVLGPNSTAEVSRGNNSVVTKRLNQIAPKAHFASGQIPYVEIPLESPRKVFEGPRTTGMKNERSVYDFAPLWHTLRPVLCNWSGCGITLASLENLRRHIFRSHEEAIRRRIACRWADCLDRSTTFLSMQHLIDHIIGNHISHVSLCPYLGCERLIHPLNVENHCRRKHEGDRRRPSAAPQKPVVTVARPLRYVTPTYELSPTPQPSPCPRKFLHLDRPLLKEARPSANLPQRKIKTLLHSSPFKFNVVRDFTLTSLGTGPQPARE